MSYVTKYQSHFSNNLSEDYELFLAKTDFVGDPMELEVQEVQERSVTGDEDRLTPILGRELLVTFKVRTTDTVSIADLIAVNDSDIKVTLNLVKSTGERSMIFQGFVVVEDNNQPFLDKPFLLSIRALDGLGLLKGVDLVDTNNLKFTGSLTVIEWIAQILYKTQQDLPVRVYFNIFPLNLLESSAFDEISLNSITFSQGDPFNQNPLDPSVDPNAINSDDCYTALEKIIRCFRCRLFMEDGRFNIVSLWDHMNPAGFDYVEFNMTAPVSGIVPVATAGNGQGINYDVPVGKTQNHYPTTGDALLYLKLGYKWVKMTYNYDQSLNKICNQDFSEGNANPTFDEVISSAIIDPTIVPVVNLNTYGYDLYCWTHLNGSAFSGFPPVQPSNSPDKAAFIRSVKDQLGYELYRFAVIQTTNSNGKVTYLKSSIIKIDQNDVFQLNFEWRTRVQANDLWLEMWVCLTGDDGSFWALYTPDNDGIAATWVSTDSNFQTGGGSGAPIVIQRTVGPTPATTDWTSESINGNLTPYAKIPVSGNLQVFLTGYHIIDDPVEIWYRNVQVTVVPFLIGSYQQLKGDYNFSSIDPAIVIKQTSDLNVEISDSPKRYFKGALLQNDGETLLSPSFHRKGKNGLESFRFTQGMERIVWNLLSRMVYKIEGNIKGHLYQSEDLDYHPSGFMNNYFFVDGDFPTKKFILTSYDRSLTKGEGRHVFVEIVEDQNADPFIDPSVSPNTYKFDYIFK